MGCWGVWFQPELQYFEHRHFAANPILDSKRTMNSNDDDDDILSVQELLIDDEQDKIIEQAITQAAEFYAKAFYFAYVGFTVLIFFIVRRCSISTN